MEPRVETSEVVIPKENAVFWMDGRGRWHNRHGPFRHKKIIDHFNTAIQKDGKGYYVTQERGAITEKVYFRYENTALFVTDLVMDVHVKMTLNTHAALTMEPNGLFIFEDGLYHRIAGEVAKFSERALLKISQRLKYDGDVCYFCQGDESWKVPVLRTLPGLFSK